MMRSLSFILMISAGVMFLPDISVAAGTGSSAQSGPDSSPDSSPGSPGARGLVIAKTIKSRQSGYVNYSAEMKMVLTAGGGQRVRQLRILNREVAGDGEQSVAVFQQPADVKGTVFLTHTHVRGDDSQWLFLPSLKRIKRISARNKTASFMGSEFSYEDLGSDEVEKFRYRLVQESTLGHTPVFVLDRMPVSAHSGYARQRVWVEKDRYVILQVQYHDKRGRLLKTLQSGAYKLFLNKFWRATRMTMKNHLTGRQTDLTWSNYRFQQPLTDSDFSPRGLERMR